MKRQRPLNEDNLDEDFEDAQEDDQNQVDAAFQQKLLVEPVDVGSLLQKLKDKKIQEQFGRGRPATFLAVLDKLLSLELQDPKHEEARYQALEALAKMKIPRITKPEANYFLYCIGIKYAHRFSQHRKLQAAFFGKMSPIKKGGEAILAAMQGDLPALEKLNLDYAKTHEKNFPPLSLFATANNQPEVLRLLHKRGKPLRSDYRCLDPLFHAVAHGLNDLIPLLLECLRLNPEDPKNDGPTKSYDRPNFISGDQYCLRPDTPAFLLGAAAAYGQLETLKLLQGLGYKHKRCFYSMVSAAENKHFHIVEHLLGENPSQENWDTNIYNEFSLLMHLVSEEQEALVQQLLATLHKPGDQYGGCLLLDTAIRKDHLDAFIWAYDALDEFDGRDFQRACLSGSVRILSYFVNVLIPEENRLSAIYDQLREITVHDRQLPLFKKSLEHLALLGFNFIQDCALLMHFASKNKARAVKALIELGADPSVRNADNESAFDVCNGIDVAMALLEWKPSEQIKSEPRPYPFSTKSITRFCKRADALKEKRQSTDQFFKDYENIMRIALAVIEEKLALLKNADPNSLTEEEFNIRIPSLSEMKAHSELKEMAEFLENKLFLLTLRYHLKKFEWAIINLKALSKTPTADKEKQIEAEKEAIKFLLAGMSANPILFGKELKEFLENYLKSKDIEFLEILLALILSLNESEAKSIVCRSLGEILWEFDKYYAYLCCRVAGKCDGNEALRATMTLIELMGVDAAWNINEEKLVELYPEKYAQVMSKIEAVNKKLTLHLKANTNDSLLVHSARAGNLQIVRTLFEQGQLSFENLKPAFFDACSEAETGKHYEVVAYLTVNAVKSLLERKLYQSGDLKLSTELRKYLKRPIISETCMSNEELTKMESSLNKKHHLNKMISHILNSFRHAAPQNHHLNLGTPSEKNLFDLNNYICKGYETSDFQNELIPNVISLSNFILALAYHNNSAYQGNPSLQNLITFLVGKLVINPKYIWLAILLNECTQDKALKIRRQLDLFNQKSQTNYKSLSEFKQAAPLKLLGFNLYLRKAWCDLLGFRDNNKKLNQLIACKDSAQFWEQYSSIKSELDQFLDGLPKLWHRYDLFSQLESACMLEFIKIQEKSLEALRKPAETVDLLEQSSPRSSSSPRLFRSRSSEDFEGAKRLPSTDAIPPDNLKQQKL